MLISAVVLLGASVHGTIIHLAALLSDRGMTAQGAALATSIAGFGLLAGRVGTGLLLDRYFAPRVAIGFCGSAATGIVLLLSTHERGMAFLAAFLVGLGMGAEGDIITYLTSRYFGLRSFAEIYGFSFGSFIVAGACGALLMGLGFDRTGSYSVPLAGFLFAIVTAIVLFSRLGPYWFMARQPRDQTRELHASGATN